MEGSLLVGDRILEVNGKDPNLAAGGFGALLPRDYRQPVTLKAERWVKPEAAAAQDTVEAAPQVPAQDENVEAARTALRQLRLKLEPARERRAEEAARARAEGGCSFKTILYLRAEGLAGGSD